LTLALFPGQGVQSAGMGAALIDAAPDVFATASDVLGVDVVKLCLEGKSGPADLNSTRWAQPAVLTCGVAAFRVLSGRGKTFDGAAGHSVGEYAALVSADALDLTDAIRLVAERAEATDEAGRAIPGGMAAVMRIERDVVETICAQHGVALAADNGPGQLVISGPTGSLREAVAACKEAGASCRQLDVAAAFHSPVMAPAAERLAAAFSDVRIVEPRIEYWSSATAQRVSKPDEIRRLLLEQLTSPVRWRETVTGLAQRVGGVFCDLGPGRVLAGLVRRIVKGAEIFTAEELVVA
jgi:[acyl-carrier-protein] S-malonyltransferase